MKANLIFLFQGAKITQVSGLHEAQKATLKICKT